MLFTFDYNFSSDYSDLFKSYTGYETIATRFPRFMFRSWFFSFLINKTDHLLGMNQKAPWESVYSRERKSENSWSSNSLKNIEMLYRNLRLLRAISNETGAKFIATTAHYYNPEGILKTYNDSLRNFFNREKIDYFDADKIIPKLDKSVNTDFVHFTDKGTELMADGYFNVLKPIIAKSISQNGRK
jgi:hypothetical protein